MQPIYYTLENVDDLFAIADMDIMALVQKQWNLAYLEPQVFHRNKRSLIDQLGCVFRWKLGLK